MTITKLPHKPGWYKIEESSAGDTYIGQYQIVIGRHGESIADSYIAVWDDVKDERVLDDELHNTFCETVEAEYGTKGDQ